MFLVINFKLPKVSESKNSGMAKQQSLEVMAKYFNVRQKRQLDKIREYKKMKLTIQGVS